MYNLSIVFKLSSNLFTTSFISSNLSSGFFNLANALTSVSPIEPINEVGGGICVDWIRLSFLYRSHLVINLFVYKIAYKII